MKSSIYSGRPPKQRLFNRPRHLRGVWQLRRSRWVVFFFFPAISVGKMSANFHLKQLKWFLYRGVGFHFFWSLQNLKNLFFSIQKSGGQPTISWDMMGLDPPKTDGASCHWEIGRMMNHGFWGCPHTPKLPLRNWENDEPWILGVPSGKPTVCDIENGHRNSRFTH